MTDYESEGKQLYCPVEDDILAFVKEKVKESFRNGLEAAQNRRSNRRSKVGFSLQK
ncbi:MAG: hypothetical protein V3V72_02035 [Ignavibacteriaceae bacterium]